MTIVGDRRLTLADFEKVVLDKNNVSLNQKALDKVDACHEFLKKFAEEKVIYGINTGFGPMAQYKIADAKRVQLQYNLIRSHCSGMGEIFGETYVRSAMLCQLNTLMQGCSGVDRQIVELIVALINEGIYPVVFKHGGVGASGDLVQLAHLALGYIGEGEVLHQGEKRDCKALLAEKISNL